ncbi:hypothetical protein NMG60_11036739 [Bertholletia excelsa]
MTMPIGTIVKLTREHNLTGEIGSLNNLYSSVEDLDEEYMNTERKELLLNARSATSVYNRSLKLDLTNSTSSGFYACGGSNCQTITYYHTAFCQCGKPIDRSLRLPSSPPMDGGVFVKPTARFMITDAFRLLPMSIMTGISLLSDFGAIGESKKEERTLKIGKHEIVKLLKCSLTSRTPLSDALLADHTKQDTLGEYRQSTHEFRKLTRTANTDSEIRFKLIYDTVNNKAICAEVEENFVDVLFSFLAIPIGYAFKEPSCLSSKGCMGNLYGSILDFDVTKFFKSEEMKEMLVNPKLAPGLVLDNKMIGIEEAVNPSYNTLTDTFQAVSVNFSSESPLGEPKAGGGFLKGSSLFMVTDNLSITPLSSISGISLINRLMVPLEDVGELEMTMGKEEACRLLAGCLLSRTALTDAFMLKEPKQEPRGDELVYV